MESWRAENETTTGPFQLPGRDRERQRKTGRDRPRRDPRGPTNSRIAVHFQSSKYTSESGACLAGLPRLSIMPEIRAGSSVLLRILVYLSVRLSLPRFLLTAGKGLKCDCLLWYLSHWTGVSNSSVRIDRFLDSPRLQHISCALQISKLHTPSGSKF